VAAAAREFAAVVVAREEVSLESCEEATVEVEGGGGGGGAGAAVIEKVAVAAEESVDAAADAVAELAVVCGILTGEEIARAAAAATEDDGARRLGDEGSRVNGSTPGISESPVSR